MFNLVALLVLVAAVAAHPQWVFNYEALGHPGGVAIFNNAVASRSRAPHGYTSYQHVGPQDQYEAHRRAPHGYTSYQREVPQDQYEAHRRAPHSYTSYQHVGPQDQYEYSQQGPQMGSIEAARALAQAQDTSRGLPQIIPDTPEVQRAKARFAEEYERAALLSARKSSYY